MKLFYAPASPYARKVRIFVIEKGLEAQVEAIAVDPYGPAESLKAANPLGKVPSLVVGGGQAIFDSAVICDYLDSIGAGASLWPTGDAIWAAKTRASLADGMMDALFATVMEGRRPETERSKMWIDRWRAAFLRSVDAVEADADSFGHGFSGDLIGLACAVAYADFRLPDCNWRAGHPALAAWYERIWRRPSMVATAPSTI